ncbi:MAG: T9SS type A sorting domain-containing protein [Ignavibacteriae bacterium]|nr:T9SS type A sorting domain-containing protein [Ignavibacteriota bacterium]
MNYFTISLLFFLFFFPIKNYPVTKIYSGKELFYNYIFLSNNNDSIRIQYLEDDYYYDVLHYEIHIDVTDTLRKEITSNVIFKAIPTDSNFSVFIFDLDNSNSGTLQVDSIIYNGRFYKNEKLNIAEDVSWVNNKIRCQLPEAMRNVDSFYVNVFYHGKPFNDFFNWPHRGLAFHRHNGTIIVEMMSEPESAHYWLACKDIPKDKATMDFFITTWNTQLAASNGLLQSKTNIEGNKTIHWWKVTYPITSYLIAFSVTNYTLMNQTYTSLDGNKTMPIQNFVYPEKFLDAENDFSRLPEMIKAMALRFGEYPFINEKYGNAMVTYPGMEHQTISAMGDMFIDGTGQSEDWLVFHELAHHWLGDQVTCATWNDTWLNEGGATFMESLWEEYKGGEEAYIRHMLNFKDTALSHPEPLWSCKPPFGINVYYKGAWVYHMLRYYIGDSLFFGSMKNYLNESPHSYGTATTEQFFDYMQIESGINLEKFKDQWLIKGGHPNYGFAYKIDNKQNSSELKFQVKQIQELDSLNSIFKMPIPILIKFEDGSDTILNLDDSLLYQVFTFNFDKRLLNNISDDNINYKEKLLCTKSFIQYNDVEEINFINPELYSITPNPAINEITINFKINNTNNIKIILQNLLGEIVLEKQLINNSPGNHSERLDISEITSGSYTLILLHNGKRVSKRFMVVK